MIPSLRRVNIEITNACNLNCRICADRRERRISYIDPIVVEFLLKELKKEMKPFPEVRLFLSGEPTMHVRFLEVMKRTLALNVPILIHTNGIKMDEKMIDQLAQFDLENLHVSFSLDGGDPNSYREIRLNPNFDKIKSNIQYFIAKHTKAKITVQCIVTFNNKRRIPYITKLYKNMFSGARIYVRTPHNWNVADSVNGSESKRYGFPCDFLFHDLVIYSDLTVGLCCACLNQEVTFGNIITDFNSSIIDAFYCDGLKDYRKRMLSREYVPVCSECERYNP